MIKAYKLYTGSDGHSYFQEGYVAEIDTRVVNKISFKESPAGSVYEWHTAPTTQYVVCLNGTLEFEMHSGKTFIFSPGEILIAMDTTGSGHNWKIVDDQPWKRVYITFDKDTEPNFVENGQ